MAEAENYDVMIIGAGVAGLSAAIYAARSGMKTIIVEAQGAGGQTTTAAEIENYPGFINIGGMDLAIKFKQHAEEYVKVREAKEIEKVDKLTGQEDVTFKLTDGDGDEYFVGTIILATGAKHRKIGAHGEERLSGKGVSYCATCDGFFFKGKKVFMIGGGNTALMDAIYLKGIGVDVTLVHRRDEFRGEKAYHDKVKELGIPVIWNSVVEKIDGDPLVEKISLKNVKTGEITEHSANGVFIAVGIIPSNKLAKELGCETDNSGYVKTDSKMRTTIPFVYAAGDITGGLQQVVTGASEGAIAATQAFEDLANPYWVD